MKVVVGVPCNEKDAVTVGCVNESESDTETDTDVESVREILRLRERTSENE